jgi:hypothetical protein
MLGNEVFAAWFGAPRSSAWPVITVTLSVEHSFKLSWIVARYEAKCIAAFNASNSSISRLVVILAEAER